MRQSGWEGSLGKNGYRYMYGWISSLFTWNYHNIVNWLCTNRKLEKEMATHSSILAWEITWKGDPGRLQSMESQRAGHYWSCMHAHMIENKKLKKFFFKKELLFLRFKLNALKDMIEVSFWKTCCWITRRQATVVYWRKKSRVLHSNC